MTELTDRHEEALLYERVAQIVEAARVHVSRTVNTAMVHAYWLIGREIVTYPSVKRMKQFHVTFPDGSAIPDELGAYRKGSALLSQSPALSPPEKGSAPLSQLAEAAPVLFPPLLSWTHYLILMRVENPQARAACCAASCSWT